MTKSEKALNLDLIMKGLGQGLLGGSWGGSRGGGGGGLAWIISIVKTWQFFMKFAIKLAKLA